MTAASRKSLLAVASSSCQLYSGTGKALFDWIRLARETIEISLLVDSGNSENFEIASAFCRDHAVRLYPSEAGRMPGCPDLYPLDASRVLRSRAWDFVECLSWASAATNLEVMSNLPDSSRLLFTPHTQPMWTLPSPERFFMVPRVLEAMLRTCDLVFVDTPHELAHVDHLVASADRVSFIPLGVDTGRVGPAQGAQVPRAPKRLLSVFDFREMRKRPDLLIAAFEAIVAADSSFELIIAGKGSQNFRIPAALERRVIRLGYISVDELVHQYRSSSAFMLLSDFEAFGLPIAEALCCGTPVIMTRQRQTESVFGGLPGVYLVDNTDAAAVRDAVLSVTGLEMESPSIAAHAAARFSVESTYVRKLAQVSGLPAGARVRALGSAGAHSRKCDRLM